MQTTDYGEGKIFGQKRPQQNHKYMEEISDFY